MELLKIAERCFKITYTFNVHANVLVTHPQPISISFERIYASEVFMHWKVELKSFCNNVLSVTAINDKESLLPSEFRALQIATSMINFLPIDYDS